MVPVLKTSIVLGEGFDPYANLALEELLLEQLKEDEALLYLWQNQHTVVIGRNQNAFRECHMEKLEADGGFLARRLSGGGAVYHDLGNVNFTFVVPKAVFDLHRQCGIILHAVQSLGIQAEFSGRNDLLAKGRKFSGNAYCHGKTASYHHGTILVDVDMGVMQQYLNVPAQKMASKGVESVRSRVVNLKELAPSLTIEMVKEAMRREFVKGYGGEGEVLYASSLKATPEFGPLLEKYQSWDWRIGKSPSFDIFYETRFPWGGIELGLQVDGGIVKTAKIYSDAMDADWITGMEHQIIGVEFNRKVLAQAVRNRYESADDTMVADIASWIEETNTTRKE